MSRPVEVVDGKKPCRGCGENKPLEDFPRRAQHSTGRGPRCKACESARANAYRRTNQPARTEYQRDYRDGMRLGRKGRPRDE